MRLDEVAGGGEKFEDPRLDLMATRSVMVKKDLIVFKFGGPVSAYKYTDLNDAELLQKTTLATLPHKGHLEEFSVVNLANTFIVLTGGQDRGFKRSAKAFKLILKRGKWQ